jgi:hypothetical protein
MMSDWLLKATELLPEMENEAGWEFIDSPMSLWHEIWWVFERAYEPPRDEGFIKRVYDFADWCSVQPRGCDASSDLLTCVAVCFYEHIPTHPAARADMPRWFKRDEVAQMRATFGYFLSAPEFEELLELFGPLQSNRKTKRQKNRHSASGPEMPSKN